tara:strand:- start:286 stop:1308 length:1023 start_codon:yes stop_codon:yes gene_type:complete
LSAEYIYAHNFAKGAEGALAAIFSVSGLSLTDNERALFKECDPFGVILFKRNCDTPEQVSSLVKDIKETLGRDCPVLIDQEGGRVQRLKPPHWREHKPMQYFGNLYTENAEKGLEALRFETFRLAEELVELGVNVNCAPVLDIIIEGAHDIIGDRSFSSDPEIVTRLGISVCRHFLKSGVLPIIKHIPGHGRAKADSHLELPHVDAPYDELSRTDFKPFKGLAVSDVGQTIWGMTAHIVYDDLNKDLPVSISEEFIQKYIRDDIGFEGVLLCDDLEMKALDKFGTLPELAVKTLDAGCDLTLYCGGEYEKMAKIAEKIGKISQKTLKRLHDGAEYGTLAV